MDDKILSTPQFVSLGLSPAEGGGGWGMGSSGCVAAKNLSSKGFSSLLLSTKLANKNQGGIL